METTKESPTTPRRVIKRYSNRKLYDTKDSRYVTLQQIGEMVRAGEEVQIIDNKTKEDKTEVTLALILSEDLKSQPRSVPLGALRDLIQERSTRLLSSLREGAIGRLIATTEEDLEATEDDLVAAEGAGVAARSEGSTAASVSPKQGAAPSAKQEGLKPGERTGEKVADKAPERSVDSDKKSRLSGIVDASKHTLEGWQHAVDERIRLAMPGVRELQMAVRELTQRVEHLERELADLREAGSSNGADAQAGGDAQAAGGTDPSAGATKNAASGDELESVARRNNRP